MCVTFMETYTPRGNTGGGERGDEFIQGVTTTITKKILRELKMKQRTQKVLSMN